MKFNASYKFRDEIASSYSSIAFVFLMGVFIDVFFLPFTLYKVGKLFIKPLYDTANQKLVNHSDPDVQAKNEYLAKFIKVISAVATAALTLKIAAFVFFATQLLLLNPIAMAVGTIISFCTIGCVAYLSYLSINAAIVSGINLLKKCFKKPSSNSGNTESVKETYAKESQIFLGIFRIEVSLRSKPKTSQENTIKPRQSQNLINQSPPSSPRNQARLEYNPRSLIWSSRLAAANNSKPTTPQARAIKNGVLGRS